MAQQLIQSVAADLVVYLTTTGGLPATGKIFSDVTCSFRKEGASGFTAKTLTALNFIEIGSGVYTITFTASDLNTLGTFTYIVNGSGLSQFTDVAQVVAASVASTAISPPLCVITGHINDLTGAPSPNVAVSMKILGLPTIIDVGTAGVGIRDDLVSTLTDSNGQFFITVIRQASVQVFIPEINYSRTLIVPNSASADLFLIP